MKPKYKVCLCRGCIDYLDEYYGYTIPRNQLEIIEVPLEECDNFEPNLDNYDERLTARNPDWT